MTAYYNEFDPLAAAWLRELIKRGHIAPGVVDSRPIQEVRPADLEGFTQCHFFAGIGVWSYALRLAGWPDEAPVWTGSCPCQPFSAAGKHGGTADERHLWPVWFGLIRECRPPVVFGEQVASPAGLGWFDAVSADVEGEGYAAGAADLCAAGVGAPHLRQRLYFVADTSVSGNRSRDRQSRAGVQQQLEDRGCGLSGFVADSAGTRQAGAKVGGVDSEDEGKRGRVLKPERSGSLGWACDWIPCRDGKARPVEPGTFPLAHGAPARVGRLRGYGNAIVAPVAQAFVSAYMDTLAARAAA